MRHPRFQLALLVAPILTGSALAQEVIYEEVWDPANFNELLGIDDVEITPDGRYAVARDNTDITSVRIYDLLNPGPPVVIDPSVGTASGPCQDGVGVTNERAVVIGSQLLIMDLTQPGFPVLLAEEIGEDPRDLAVTPDGSKVVVRGGDGANSGCFVYDLASATRIASNPGEIGDYFDPFIDPSVDTVVADNNHAVTLSLVGPTTAPTTRVTVWDLNPGGGAAPTVVFETAAGTDLDGEPHDLVMSPNGQSVAVRAMNEVALVNLAQAASGIQWVNRLWLDPGSLGGSAMDSIDMTDSAIIAISRNNSSTSEMQVDLFDLAGNQSHGYRTGDPHDLAITPDGTRAVVRTSKNVQLWDLTSLPATTGTFLSPMDEKVFAGNFTGFAAGLDSIVVTDTRAVGLSAINVTEAKVRVWDISADTLEGQLTYTLPSGSLDVTITPDESKAIAVGIEDMVVIDLVGNSVLLEQAVFGGAGGYSWCDGVVANDDMAIAFGTFNGTTVTFGGWLTSMDLFNSPVRYCGSTVNSTGEAGILVATGSSDEIDNNLRLVAGNLPADQFGVFFYGDQAQSVPFGNGNNCVGGQVAQFDVQTTGPEGFVELSIDNLALPAGGGALTAGTSWNFQYVFRDRMSTVGALFNLTDALTVTFE